MLNVEKFFGIIIVTFGWDQNILYVSYNLLIIQRIQL
jgi:hypothetical protein